MPTVSKAMSKKDTSSKFEQEIDKNLKRAFDDIAQQDLPSRFTDLLDQLRAQDEKALKRGQDNED